jgi:hypothetical protein
MKTPQQITEEVILRMKNTNLNKFDIKREVGPNWLPNGTVPFDLHASHGIATFEVWAESLQDAEDQVNHFLEQENNE